MRIEYAYYDIAANDIELQQNLENAIKYSPDCISVFPTGLKTLLKIIPEHIESSCIIDYPFGLSTHESRIHEINNCIKLKPDILEIVCPIQLLVNRKYDKFRREIDEVLSILSTENIKVRYLLEYKIFNLNLLCKISSILESKGINVVYPSIGHLLDNISDNLLAGSIMQKKSPKSQIIINGPVWTDKHIRLILNNTSFFGYKTQNIFALEKIFNKIQSN